MKSSWERENSQVSHLGDCAETKIGIRFFLVLSHAIQSVMVSRNTFKCLNNVFFFF